MNVRLIGDLGGIDLSRKDRLNVVIIGTGYVGLTTAVTLAYLGHNVTAVDVDERKIEMLKNGKSPIHEQGIEELLPVIKNNIRFTTELETSVPNSDVILIAVGTPPKTNGEADTSYVEEAVENVSKNFVNGRQYTLVVKSTVPIGTNRRVRLIVERVVQERNLNCKVYIASNPEFFA